MAIKKEIVDELLKDVDPKAVFSSEGLLSEIKKALAERMLNAELDQHLAAEAAAAADGTGAGNHRNGYSKKTAITDASQIELEIPRDRRGTFEPQLVAKYQRRFPGFDQKIISMYARGMSVRDIQGHLREFYGIEASPQLISTVTDAVLEEVGRWQTRPLDAIHVLVFFDALRVKMRDEGTVRNKAVYLAIGRWLRTEYPAITRQARQDRAMIYWGDEMGLRSDHASGTRFAPRGQTPIVRATGQRFGCNMISAITSRGHLAFMVFHGKFDGRLFIRFMQRLLEQAPGKLYLIVDGHPVHRSVVAKKFVSANEDRLRLTRLPGYCPELNPDELLNQDVKTNGLWKSRPENRTEMMAGVRSHLRRRQRQPQVIRNLFQERHVRYAA